MIDFSAVPILDSTAAATIDGFVRKATRHKAAIYIAGARKPVRRVLLVHGVRPPRVRFRSTLADALASAHEERRPTMLSLLQRPLEERRYLHNRRQAAPPRGLYIRRLNGIVLRDDASCLWRGSWALFDACCCEFSVIGPSEVPSLANALPPQRAGWPGVRMKRDRGS